MKEKIEAVLAEIEALQCKTEAEIEEARVRLLGKKGEITALFEEFRSVAPELKREFGQKLNQLKNAAAAKIEAIKETLATTSTASSSFDATMPGDPYLLGSRHPVSIVRKEIVDIFRKFGTDINKLNIVATYNLIFNAALLVSRGVGCALTLDKLVKDDNFCFKPLYPQVCSGLNIVWKKSRTFSTPAEFFLEMLQKKLKKTV